MSKETTQVNHAAIARRNRLQDHYDDMLNALLILELIDEEESVGTPRLAGLITLGKATIGNKMQLLQEMLMRHKAEADNE